MSNRSKNNSVPAMDPRHSLSNLTAFNPSGEMYQTPTAFTASSATAEASAEDGGAANSGTGSSTPPVSPLMSAAHSNNSSFSTSSIVGGGGQLRASRCSPASSSSLCSSSGEEGGDGGAGGSGAGIRDQEDHVDVEVGNRFFLGPKDNYFVIVNGGCTIVFVRGSIEIGHFNL